MPQRSAGLLMHRRVAGALEFLLVHPGGPFWARKDEGAWSIPKGLYEEGEDPLAAAKREFREETGSAADGECIPLGEFRLPSGKLLRVWAVEGDFEVSALTSNLFEMEWPPKSGKSANFPEVDRAGWFTPDVARAKVTSGQRQVIDAAVIALTD